MEKNLNDKIQLEIKQMDQSYKNEIVRMEFQMSSMLYKSKEINKLIDDDNVDKLKRVTSVDINDALEVQRVLTETPTIKLLNEYLDELSHDIANVKQELERKRSFHERIKHNMYKLCQHLWISDHFENPALMSMVGCTYCNSCGLVKNGDA
jgi:hypothetical protein